MKKIFKIITISAIASGYVYASDLNALTDATVKLIQNQTKLQTANKNLSFRINNIQHEVGQNKILIKKNNDLVVKTNKLANDFQKKITNNEASVANIQKENKEQTKEIKTLLKEIEFLKANITSLKDSIKLNEQITQNNIKILKKDFAQKSNKQKNNLVQQITNIKTDYNKKINNLKINSEKNTATLDAKLTSELKNMGIDYNKKINNLKIKLTNLIKLNSMQSSVNKISIHNLLTAHNTDIKLLKSEFNKKLTELKKVLQGEIDILAANFKGLGPVVVVDNSPSKKVLHPTKIVKENNKKDLNKAEETIKNFLGR